MGRHPRRQSHPNDHGAGRVRHAGFIRELTATRPQMWPATGPRAYRPCAKIINDVSSMNLVAPVAGHISRCKSGWTPKRKAMEESR